jgi:hypothetical protein
LIGRLHAVSAKRVFVVVVIVVQGGRVVLEKKDVRLWLVDFVVFPS